MLARRLRRLSIPIAAFAAWEVFSRIGALPLDTVSRPSAVVVAGWAAMLDGSIPVATIQSLEAALLGLAIAILIGVVVGLIVSISSIAAIALEPSMEVLRPVPPVALIPLSLLLLGFGLSMEAAVVAFACVWPVVIATAAAVRSVEPRLLEVARVLELPVVAQIAKIILPATLARIIVGIRVAAGIALVVAITVEIVVNPRGLGYSMITAQQSLRADLMYAELLWLGAVGWLLNFALLQLDRAWLRRFAIGGGAS
jgi:NitT/TauT family transport system permease protein